jgi:hypothetical protein
LTGFSIMLAVTKVMISDKKFKSNASLTRRNRINKLEPKNTKY